jgi:hypothetical protein
MKSNNFPLKAIALAVSLAMVPAVHAQTNSNVDTAVAGLPVVTNGVINSSQNVIGTVSAVDGGDIVIGTTDINGVGIVTIEATGNTVDLLAAGNGLLDSDALGSSINLIDVPVLSTDAIQSIASGQRTEGAIDATENNELLIGAELSGAVTGAITADASNNDAGASSQANAIDNRIIGDFSNTNNGVNGVVVAVATNTATTAEADLDAGSDVGIANAQAAGGSVTSNLTPTDTGVIGVEFGSTAALTSAAATSVNVNSTSLGADSGVNSALNQINVDGGGALSRDIANAQLGTAMAASSATVQGFAVGASDNNDATFSAAVTVAASSSSASADAEGNQALNQINVNENAALSNQSIANTQDQLANTAAIVEDLAVGVSLTNADSDLFDLTLDASANAASATSRANDATNQVLLTGIATGANNTITSIQNGQGQADSTADVDSVSFGLVTAGDVDGAASTVNVLSSDVEANASGNNTTNIIQSAQDAGTTTNAVNNTQSSGVTTATVEDVQAGAAFTAATTVAGTLNLTASSSSVQASASGNATDNDIVLVGAGTSSTNDITNVQNVQGAVTADAGIADNGIDIGINDALGVIFSGTVTTELLSNNVDASAAGAAANNRIAIGQIATNSNNQVNNDQNVAVGAAISADVDDVSVGVKATGGTTTFAAATGLDLDVASTAITTSASGTNATNQVLFTGIAGNSVANDNDVINTQDVESNVSATTNNDISVGLNASGANLLVTTGDLSVSTLSNTVSSDASVNLAVNSIDALGSIEAADNDVSNTQGTGITGIAVTSTTSGVSLGANVDVTTAFTVAGVTNIDSTSNVASSRARVNTSSNTISVADAGSANNSVNTVVNTQSTIVGTTVTSTTSTVDIGLSVGAIVTAGTLTGLVTSSTNSNTVSSAATVNTAFNTVDLDGLADGTDNDITNNQTVIGNVESVTGVGANAINIGVSVLSTDLAITDTFLITANGNDVSSAANGNVGVNVIDNDTSSQNSENMIASTQLNTGKTDAESSAINIGIVAAELGAASAFSVSANANDVTSSVGFNAVNNIVDLESLANASTNNITNIQTATLTANSGATVSDVSIGSASVDADTSGLASITATVQSNIVSADTVGNSAFNSISVDDFGTGLTNDVVNTQTVTGGFELGATASTADIGLTFAAGVVSSDTLVAQVSGNDVSATVTGNTAVNLVANTLFGGAGTNVSINNTQVASNTSFTATVGGANIGINGGAGSIVGVATSASVTANGNSIRAAAIGNSAINRVTGLTN